MAAPAPDIPIDDLPARLSAGTRLLGLDLGTKTIGLALSDRGQRFASALKTLKRGKFKDDAAALMAICAKESVGALVLGLPVNMNGTEGPRAQATRAFARNLAPLIAQPIVLWDERLTTVAAERAMIEADMSRRKRSEKIDAVAASYILQGALDRLARLAPPA
jgi:putative Holliday junction resolvase